MSLLHNAIVTMYSQVVHQPSGIRRNDYDEETAYESYMNPKPGFQSGPGDSVDAD